MSASKKIKDILISTENFAVVDKNSTIKDAIDEIGNSSLGICCLIDKNYKLLGLFTDGDLRRYIYSSQKPMPEIYTENISSIIKKNPITAKINSNPNLVLKKMIKYSIWDVPITNNYGKLLGIIHMHDLAKVLL